MTRMPVPLALDQIEAACRLHAELPFWRAADQALEALHQRLPGFRDDAALLKVVAINSLYYTNVYAVARMAKHVESVMAATDLASAGPDLVERLAKLPKTDNHKRQFTFPSFASKFAHFFIDPERFSILDSYAASIIKLHLGTAEFDTDQTRPYLTYVANFQKLRQRSSWTVRTRELDRYLWIAGQYRFYLKKQKAPINTELRQLFATPSPEASLDLDRLQGRRPEIGSTKHGRHPED